MKEQVLGAQIKSLKSYERDVTWFQNHYKQLQHTYKGKFVAVKNCKVIDKDKDAMVLMHRLKQKVGNTSNILVEDVSTAKFEYIL